MIIIPINCAYSYKYYANVSMVRFLLKIEKGQQTQN